MKHKMEEIVLYLHSVLPFVGFMVDKCQLEYKEDLDAAFAMVTFKGSRPVIIYGDDFLELPLEKAAGILWHEICHIVQRHLTTRKFPPGRNFETKDIKDPEKLKKIAEDAERWELAQELEINENIVPLDRLPLTIEEAIPSVIGLPLHHIAEEYFLMLKEKNIHRKRPRIGKKGRGKTKQKIDILVPGDKSCSDELRDDVIRDMVRRSVEQAKGNTAGMEGVIDKLLETTDPWIKRLRKFLRQNVAKIQYQRTWKIPHKRVSQYIEPWPGHKKDEKGNIVFAVDSSGSMTYTQYVMKVGFGEIHRVARQLKSSVRVLVTDCSEKITDFVVNPFHRPEEIKIESMGGGTDFRPIFNYIKDKEIKPDVLVFYTDTWGDFPEETPEYPVLWLVPHEGEIWNPPFGEVVRISFDGVKL